MDEIYIASFDIGKINFAFCIEKCLIKDLCTKYSTIDDMCFKGNIVHVENIRLMPFTKKKNSRYSFDNLLFFLEQRKNLWNKCHIFVIEQQMSQNRDGIKISYHLEAYFKTCYGTFKEVVLFPSYHKTQVFEKVDVVSVNNRKRKKYTKLSYVNRKCVCVDKAFEILKNRKDQNTICKLESSKKKDDMCDVICQLQAYKWLKLSGPITKIF